MISAPLSQVKQQEFSGGLVFTYKAEAVGMLYEGPVSAIERDVVELDLASRIANVHQVKAARITFELHLLIFLE